MIIDVTLDDFIKYMNKHTNEFSCEGLKTLYEHLNELQPEYKLDHIQIRCDFEECTIEEALNDCGFEKLDQLENITTVLKVKNDVIIYRNF